MDATLRIVIKLNNAAFEDDPSHEVARILRKAADRLDGKVALHDEYKLILMDFNGNEVGYMEVSPS